MVDKIKKPRIDMIGQTFNWLKCIEYKGTSKWLCECKCGNTTIVTRNKLIRGHTKSCGCYRNTRLSEERRLGLGVAAFREVMRSFKQRAKKINVPFDLDDSNNYELYAPILQENCWYCGAKPRMIEKYRGSTGIFTHNGLDRIDSSKGYVIGNIVPCCTRCNYAKNNMSLEEFVEWIERIYNNSKEIREKVKSGYFKNVLNESDQVLKRMGFEKDIDDSYVLG